MRVLLIDDNPDDRVLIRRELTRHFPELEVEDIRAELDLRRALQTAAVDLVITDFELRWTNGIEILQRIKGRFPECPVVMFTGTGTQEIAVAAMKAGLDDYVIKAAAHYVRLPVAVEGALGRSAARARARQRQRRFDDMLGSLGVGVFRADGEGRIREANAAMLSALGAASPDDLRELDLTALVEAAREGKPTPTLAAASRVGGGVIQLRVSGGVVEEPDGTSLIEGIARPVAEG
jgi:DNA-binding response OmpR family regulator